MRLHPTIEQYSLHQLAMRDRSAAARCADCGGPIGHDAGPKDGWQLEDGRTVCQRCCGQDLIRFADRLKAQSESVAARAERHVKAMRAEFEGK